MLLDKQDFTGAAIEIVNEKYAKEMAQEAAAQDRALVEQRKRIAEQLQSKNRVLVDLIGELDIALNQDRKQLLAQKFEAIEGRWWRHLEANSECDKELDGVVQRELDRRRAVAAEASRHEIAKEAQFGDSRNIIQLGRNQAEEETRGKFERRLAQKQRDDRQAKEEAQEALDKRVQALHEQLRCSRRGFVEQSFSLDECEAKAKGEAVVLRQREGQLIADYEARLLQASQERRDLLTEQNQGGIRKRQTQDREHTEALGKLLLLITIYGHITLDSPPCRLLGSSDRLPTQSWSRSEKPSRTPSPSDEPSPLSGGRKPRLASIESSLSLMWRLECGARRWGSSSPNSGRRMIVWKRARLHTAGSWMRSLCGS